MVQLSSLYNSADDPVKRNYYFQPGLENNVFPSQTKLVKLTYTIQMLEVIKKTNIWAIQHLEVVNLMNFKSSIIPDESRQLDYSVTNTFFLFKKLLAYKIWNIEYP